MTPVTLTLPLPPNLANSRQHWRVKLNAKKEYWKRLDLVHAAKLLPRYDVPPVVTVSAAIVVGGLMDTDNLFARLKWALDWLVANGYLPGDRPDQLIWADIPTQTVKRRKDGAYSLTLTITEIPVCP